MGQFTNEPKKSSRDRKNYGSAEYFQKLRKKTNAARPKQFWVGGESVKEGGHWTRDIIVI